MFFFFAEFFQTLPNAAYNNFYEFRTLDTDLQSKQSMATFSEIGEGDLEEIRGCVKMFFCLTFFSIQTLLKTLPIVRNSKFVNFGKVTGEKFAKFWQKNDFHIRDRL